MTALYLNFCMLSAYVSSAAMQCGLVFLLLRFVFTYHSESS